MPLLSCCSSRLPRPAPLRRLIYILIPILGPMELVFGSIMCRLLDSRGQLGLPLQLLLSSRGNYEGGPEAGGPSGRLTPVKAAPAGPRAQDVAWSVAWRPSLNTVRLRVRAAQAPNGSRRRPPLCRRRHPTRGPPAPMRSRRLAGMHQKKRCSPTWPTCWPALPTLPPLPAPKQQRPAQPPALRCRCGWTACGPASRALRCCSV